MPHQSPLDPAFRWLSRFQDINININININIRHSLDTMCVFGVKGEPTYKAMYDSLWSSPCCPREPKFQSLDSTLTFEQTGTRVSVSNYQT